MPSKNNIGKSSLLDIIEIINNPEQLWNNRETKIYIEKNYSLIAPNLRSLVSYSFKHSISFSTVKSGQYVGVKINSL